VYAAIDIDGTVATAGVSGDLATNVSHFRAQGICLPQDIPDFFDLVHHPDVIPLHHPLDGAIEGTKHLARLMPLGYYTVRKHADAVRQQAIEERTRQWLDQQGFPNPHAVVFCKSVLDKLVQLVEREGTREEAFLLIDDRWQKAIEAFTLLDAHSEYGRSIAALLRSRLTIVAFGAQTIIPTQGLSVVALPSWEHLPQLLVRFS
jgi:hypothetical protein